MWILLVTLKKSSFSNVLAILGKSTQVLTNNTDKHLPVDSSIVFCKS